MQTPIDYGKQFITDYFSRKDAEEILAFLSDDIVWVTPDEILHLRTHKEILQYLEEQLKKDPVQYKVDVASIKSAPAGGDTNTVVYDVNLIPKDEDASLNLRCSLSIHKASIGYELVYVGMSRKYTRTEPALIKGFIENVPSGVLILANPSAAILHVRHYNRWFSRRLGYNKKIFRDKVGENPFFIMPYEDQKKVMTAVARLNVLKEAKPVTVRVMLEHVDGTGIPAQAVVSLVKDGGTNMLYIIFQEITEILRDEEKVRRKAEDEARELQKKEDDAIIAESLEKADEAVRKAVSKAEKLVRKAEKKSQEKVAEILAKAERNEDDAQRRIDEARADAAKQIEEAESLREAAQEALKSLQEKNKSREETAKKNEKQYTERILRLEKEVGKSEEKTRKALEEQAGKLEAEHLKEMEELKEKAEAEKQALKTEAEEEKAAAEGNRQGFLARISALQGQIEHLQSDLHDQELSLQKKDRDGILRMKEKDKCLKRMQYMMSGQLQSIRSLIDMQQKETDAARAAQYAEKAALIAESLPAMTEDLIEVASLDPGARSAETAEFSMVACIDMVRKVIWPQCRERGIIFSCETAENLPDRVIGSRAGLQLAFLTVLENAVAVTNQGGKILFHASADPAVRNKVYYRFIITDTGTGIADEKLPKLFDDPTGELSAARRIISLMGGSIQVHSSVGQGSQFDIRVNLPLA